MGVVDPEGSIGKVILAVMLACVASWAGIIVLLVRIIASPGDPIAEYVLLGWMGLTVVLVATLAGTSLAARAGTGTAWLRIALVIILAPASPLLAAGVYVWRRTQPFRQSRVHRRRMAAR